jgi:hypothetical protein
MPSKTLAQHRLMLAAAHNKAFAKKVGIPMSVASDFMNADKKAGKFKAKKKK